MSLRPHLLTALGALALFLAVPSGAVSAPKPKPPKPAPGASCPATGPMAQYFQPVDGDPMTYYLAPDGSFEKRAWSGGTQTLENEPAFIGSSRDRRSMVVSSSVTSPLLCITPDAPTVRFFARRADGNLLSGLGLEVLVQTAGGEVAVPLAVLGVWTGGVWSPSLATPIGANALALLDLKGVLDGEPAGLVRFRLTPSAGSTWLVDDFYVDPYSRR